MTLVPIVFTSLLIVLGTLLIVVLISFISYKIKSKERQFTAQRVYTNNYPKASVLDKHKVPVDLYKPADNDINGYQIPPSQSHPRYPYHNHYPQEPNKYSHIESSNSRKERKFDRYEGGRKVLPVRTFERIFVSPQPAKDKKDSLAGSSKSQVSIVHINVKKDNSLGSNKKVLVFNPLIYYVDN